MYNQVSFKILLLRGVFPSLAVLDVVEDTQNVDEEVDEAGGTVSK